MVVGARERRAARHELVQHDAEAVAIRSPVNSEPARLFGRHVRDRADDHARARLDRRRHRRHRIRRGPRGPREGRDAEVEDLDVAIGPEHQVVGLDVAMHDRCGMRGRKRRRRLDRDVENFAKRQRTALQPFAHGLALDELRHQEPRSVVIADLVNGQDVGMIERGSGAGFVQEPAHALRISRELRPQHLERDRPPQGRIDGLEHFTHPAAARARSESGSGRRCSPRSVTSPETLSRLCAARP